MARQTVLRNFTLDQAVLVSGMGVVAGRTVAFAHRVMHHIPGKLFLLLCMTGIAEIIGLFMQQA